MSEERAAYDSIVAEYEAALARERSEWKAVQDKTLEPDSAS